MKLYVGKIPSLATQLVKELVKQKSIEVPLSSVPEVELDIAAVLKEYVRLDQELTDYTKEFMERRGLKPEQYNKVRREVARERKFPIEDPLAYMLDQIIEALLHSNFVEEVYVEDHDLRRVMKPVFQRYAAGEEELEREVKNQIKNLQEGTQSWEVEFQKRMAQIKRQKGYE